MKRYHCEFSGYWLGGFAIVDAESEDDARTKLVANLPEVLAEKARKEGLANIDVAELVVPESGVLILWDGDY